MPVLQEQKLVIAKDGMYASFAGAKTGQVAVTLVQTAGNKSLHLQPSVAVTA